MKIPDPTEQPMTELYDADIDRVDLVGAAANGTRFLLTKSTPNLIPADTVRELIKEAPTVDQNQNIPAPEEDVVAKSEPEEQPETDVTKMTVDLSSSFGVDEEDAVEKDSAVSAESDGAEEVVEKAETAEEPSDETVEKADGDTDSEEAPSAKAMLPVYDNCGRLVGVVDPDLITPVMGAGTTDEDGDGDSVIDADGDGDGAVSDASDDAMIGDDDAPADTIEAAAAPNLTEADGSNHVDDQDYGVDDDEDSRVIPGTNTVQSPVTKTSTAAETDIAALLKEALTPLAEELRKTAELAEKVTVLEEQVRKFGAKPDTNGMPSFNGATGANAGIAPRGGEQTDGLEPLRKALTTAQEAGDPAAIRKAQQDLLSESVLKRFQQ